MPLPKYSKILVPTDGSEFSLNAGQHAVYLAKALGAKVFILNVVNTDLAFHGGIHYAEGKADMEKTGREATGKIRAICDENGVECEEFVAEGRPQEIIVDFACKINADCIVIGSLGMSAIERVLLGSVSDSVLRHAKCPVLLIRK